MEHAGSADLLALGSHCSTPDCQQIDFLPFTCDCCGEVFCLQHRTYQSHSCPKAGARQTSTIVCPICAKAVVLTAADDPNVVFERHQQQGCDPANYAKVHQRPKCPAKGCREKLGAINTYKCKECGKQVCLKHRFPEAHQCPGKSGQCHNRRSLHACCDVSPQNFMCTFRNSCLLRWLPHACSNNCLPLLLPME